MGYVKSEAWHEALVLSGQLREAMSAMDGAVGDWQDGYAAPNAIIDTAQRYKFAYTVQRLMRVLDGIAGAPDSQPLWAAYAAVWSLESRDGTETPTTVLGKLRTALGVLERITWMAVTDAPPSRDAWVYGEAMAGKPWKEIRSRLRSISAEWEPIETDNGVKDVARRYAEKNSLPVPESRRPGRPKNTK